VIAGRSSSGALWTILPLLPRGVRPRQPNGNIGFFGEFRGTVRPDPHAASGPIQLPSPGRTATALLRIIRTPPDKSDLLREQQQSTRNEPGRCFVTAHRLSTGTGSVPRLFTKFIPARCERSHRCRGADSQDPWCQKYPHIGSCPPTLTRSQRGASNDARLHPFTTRVFPKNSPMI
jgi:hypothetical protein